MPIVNITETAPLTKQLEIIIQKEDYMDQYRRQIREYAAKADLKGFRKGKVPANVIKRMYGRGLLLNLVQSQLQEKINELLSSEAFKGKVLGQPIPVDESGQDLDFNPLAPGEYTLYFEVGVQPEFELQGLGEENTFEKLEVEVPESIIDEQLEEAREKMGEFEPVDAEAEPKDVLKVKAVTQEGAAFSHEFEYYFDLTEEAVDAGKLEELTGLKAGDTFTFQLQEMFVNMEPEAILERIAEGVDPEQQEALNAATFEGTVLEVRRNHPAEMDETFFEDYFQGHDIDNEEDARQLIREDYEKYYNQQADTLVFNRIKDHLIEQNAVDLPEGFLRRYLIFSSEKIDASNVDQQLPMQLEGTRWLLIREKIQELLHIEISKEDILEEFGNRVRKYMGGQADQQMIDMMAGRLWENQEQREEIREDLFVQELTERIQELFTITHKKVDMEEFDQEYQVFREENLKRYTRQEAAEVEEEE